MFFKKDSTKIEKNFLVKTCALLIHAAKIDENYTKNEEEIIKKTLIELGAKEETISQTIKDAKSIEENSNRPSKLYVYPIAGVFLLFFGYLNYRRKE